MAAGVSEDEGESKGSGTTQVFRVFRVSGSVRVSAGGYLT